MAILAGCSLLGLLVGCGDDGGETTRPTTNTMVTADITTPTLPTTGEAATDTDAPATDTDALPSGECGDGVIDDGEQCDDGNAVLTDECLPTCVAAVCGDGVLHAGIEDCDDTNDDDTDACIACRAAVCGDGFVHAGVEACDDANTTPGDGCSADCKSEVCGNGTVEGAETCDDANTDDTDDCTSLCMDAVCGDGFVHAGVEACDDANTDSNDACTATCADAVCGDGLQHIGVEQCDDANTDDVDGCTNACLLPTCSDALENGNETDTDCGGPDCPKCGAGKSCGATGDCMNSVCMTGTCQIPKSCQEIEAAAPELPSGVYTLDIDGPGPFTPLQAYCDQDTDEGGWLMAAKFSEGVPGDGYNLWIGGALNTDDVSLLSPAKSTKHYVSRFPSNFWNINNITVNQVRVHVYTGGALAKFWKYDAGGTNSQTWHASDRLLASSYTDLSPNPGNYNYYAIAGDAGNGRRWYINQVYNGCENDTGWLIVDSPADPCTWETRNGAPALRILYAPGATITNWNAAVNDNTIGVAETLAVFIR